MRKWMMVLVMVMVLVASVATAGDFKILGRGDGPLDWIENPLGVGLCSWTDSDFDFELGIYGQFALVSWRDAVRLNAGMAAMWDHQKDRVAVRPITSITFGIYFYKPKMMIEIGAYYAPFWGLDDRSDDPYGLMIGYIF